MRIERLVLNSVAWSVFQEDFIGSKLLTGVHLEQKEALVIISHLFGIVTLFTGLSLFHLAVFTHYRPVSFESYLPLLCTESIIF